MGKHKKHLREEKSKLKLKTKLPKGQNVTNTAFKVKKIQIADQLPEHVGIPVTYKHQTLQECINYLTHHNASKQADGLRGIKELFLAKKITPSSLEFKQVLTRVLDTAVEDVEGKIRKTAIALLSDLVKSLSVAARVPFHELLNKQLQRALSNINPGVQTDGLRLLDLVLAISRPEDSQSRQPLVGLLLRMLTMSGADAPPRAAVLHRLLATCQIVFEVPESKTETGVHVESTVTVWPLTNTYKSIPSISLDATKTTPVENNSKELIERIMKVSVGVWTEISPDKNLNKDVVAVLSSIIKISLLLLKFSAASDDLEMKSWFIDSFKKLLGRNLLQQFPYSGPEVHHPGRQPDFVENDVDKTRELMQLNFNLASLYFSVQPAVDLLPKIQQFLPVALAIRPATIEVTTLLDCMLRIKSLQTSLVEGVAASCKTEPDELLCDWLKKIAMNDRLENCHRLDHFQAWLCTLIKDPAHGELVAQMASKRMSTKLTSSLKSASREILAQKSMDKNLVHALHWIYSKEELLKKAEGCPDKTLQYLQMIL